LAVDLVSAVKLANTTQHPEIVIQTANGRVMGSSHYIKDIKDSSAYRELIKMG